MTTRIRFTAQACLAFGPHLLYHAVYLTLGDLARFDGGEDLVPVGLDAILLE